MYRKIFEEIAKMNDSTVEEVYAEMQKAISLSNHSIKNVSVEEFILLCLNTILNKNKNVQ